MAIHKPTRSPRRAQHHPNSALSRKPRRLMKPVDRLPVYENLHALNRDFEQVLTAFARLQELGVFNRHLANILRIVVQETRAWANFELAEILQLREHDDCTYFSRVHNLSDNKLRDPNLD